MPNASRFLLLFSISCALVPGRLAVAQDNSAISAATIQRLRDLLETSPLLEPTMGVVEQAQYVASAQSTLAQVPGSQPAAIESPTEATAAVESALALTGSAVAAELVSEPPGVVVSYRRLIDADAAMLQVTTNDAISLPPALYLFIATDPANPARTDTLRVACSTQCKVKFVFAAAPPPAAPPAVPPAAAPATPPQ